MPSLYTYRARCTNVVDGDTIDVVLDTGFHSTRTERLRLLGVNTPELHDKNPTQRQAAIDAKRFTTGVLDEWASGAGPWPLLVTTTKTDSFGRYLADVTSYAVDDHYLSDLILDAGHGVSFP